MAEELGVSGLPIYEPVRVAIWLWGEVRYSLGGLRSSHDRIYQERRPSPQHGYEFHPVNSDYSLSREQWSKPLHAFLMILSLRFHSRSQMKSLIGRDVS